VLGRAALFGCALAFAACTEQVLLDDLVRDAGPTNVLPQKDGPYAPPASDVACICGGYQSLSFRARTAQLIIALDHSSAMLASFDANNNRGQAAATALMYAVTNSQSLVNFGYEQFPADASDQAYQDCQRNTCCAGSVIAPSPNNLEKLKGAIVCGNPQSSPCPSPGYDTASNAALGKVRDYYNKAKNSQWIDHRYVLLVTAAEPSCSSLSDAAAACSDASDAAYDLGNMGVGIAVLTVGYKPDTRSSCLVGISKTGSLQTLPPGIEALSTGISMSDLSNKVNTFVGALARTTCTLDIQVPPPSQAQLQVQIGNSQIPQIDSPDQNGWYYENPSTRATITFAGTSCDQLVTAPAKDLYMGYWYSTCGGPSSPCVSPRP
jgi:hypothetical protein